MTTSFAYVPILRWKGAERGALGELRPETACQIRPLVEIPLRAAEEQTSAKFSKGFVKSLIGVWGTRPVMLDLSALKSRTDYPMLQSNILAEAGRHGVRAIPTTRIAGSLILSPELRSFASRSGYALRVDD